MAKKPASKPEDHVLTLRLKGDVYAKVLAERDRRKERDPDGDWNVTRTLHAMLRAYSQNAS